MLDEGTRQSHSVREMKGQDSSVCKMKGQGSSVRKMKGPGQPIALDEGFYHNFFTATLHFLHFSKK